jgi:hypothetical protein
MAYPATLVFVHGWSVTDTDTYGGLPERLAAEIGARGGAVRTRDLWLGRYVSFHDEVRMEDLARAMEAAVRRELADLLVRGERFAVITHSTGGPLARDWWWRFYASRKEPAPMSHLVMLAPANFGSALAQLGKSRISRLKSWLGGIEPGSGVLDWLEHGSPEAWELNEAWIKDRFGRWEPGGTFPFVLTGQTIDRKLYDHLNSYTGESGSDGVVRVPAANLNATLVRLEQGAGAESGVLKPVGRMRNARPSAFRVVGGKSHSGEEKGIMRSVSPRSGDGDDLVESVVRCLAVEDAAGYEALRKELERETAAVQELERVEVQPVPVLPDRLYVHDRTSLVIFRLCDSEGHALTDFDLELTGVDDDPDLLPDGFFKDRQRNRRAPNVLTYFFDYDLMVDSDDVPDPRHPGRIHRLAREGTDRLGLRVTPRPQAGFVHYATCSAVADAATLRALIKPNHTTLVDITVRRFVHREVFEMRPATEGSARFDRVKPGDLLE